MEIEIDKGLNLRITHNDVALSIFAKFVETALILYTFNNFVTDRFNAHYFPII
jgi:hypothetical protein